MIRYEGSIRVGVWIDESGKYMMVIKENQQRIPFTMMNSIKPFAKQKNIGKLAAEPK